MDAEYPDIEIPPKSPRVCRWRWIPAAAICAIGIVGLADLGAVEILGTLLLIGPHVSGFVLTALSGQRHPGAAVVTIAGSVTMAGFTWWDALDRETAGFEWGFNNAIQGAMCCGVNYVVLFVTACTVCVMCLEIIEE